MSKYRQEFAAELMFCVNNKDADQFANLKNFKLLLILDFRMFNISNYYFSYLILDL